MKSINKKIKLVALISHPIQYFTPLYKEISKVENIDFKVFFCSKIGTKPYFDKEFGKEIKFDTPLLDGYNYEFLKNISPFKDKEVFFKYINFGIIIKLCNREIDVLWIHGWSNFTNVFAMLIAFCLRVPVLIRGDSNVYNDSSGIKQLLKKFILGALFKTASSFLSCGTANKLFYKRYGVLEDKIHLMPYAINNRFFISKYEELKDKKNELREKYNIPKDLPAILFSGKLIDVKRPMDFLKAFEKIVKETPCSLILVGDGILKNEMECYIKENNIKNVFFMGFRNQTELPEFYAMSDIFVLSSFSEQWGLVVNEAMCFNLPIVVSDKVGAGYDLVKNALNGYVYSSGDIESLYQRLKILANDSNKRVNFGIQSKCIISKWSYAECTECISNVLQGIKLTL